MISAYPFQILVEIAQSSCRYRAMPVHVHLVPPLHYPLMRTIRIIASITAAVASSTDGIDVLLRAAGIMAANATTRSTNAVAPPVRPPPPRRPRATPVITVEAAILPAAESIGDFLGNVESISPRPSYSTALTALRSFGFGPDIMTDGQFKSWWLAMLKTERKRVASASPLSPSGRVPIWDRQSPSEKRARTHADDSDSVYSD